MPVSPTILIPGITGTTLVNANTLDHDTIWSGVQSKFETLADLALQEEPAFEVPPRSIIRAADVEDLAYAQIVDVIERKCASQPYVFGYDWRQSSRVNGQRLLSFVRYLGRKLQTSRFNFVTHSLGAHVFGCFLRELAGDYALLDRAVLAAPPFRGAVKALVALVVGEGGTKVPLLNANDEFRKVARTFPAAYELLPVYAGAITHASGDPFDLFDHRHWQDNVVDTAVVRTRIGELGAYWTGTPPGMFPLDELPSEVRLRIAVVAGEGEETLQRVVVLPNNPANTVRNFFDFEHPTTREGDGTVPLESAGWFHQAVATIAVKSKWYDGATHAFLLNDGRVQNVVKRWLLRETERPDWWSDIASTVRRLP